MSKALLGAGEGRGAVGLPLRYTAPQQAHESSQAQAGQRRVLVHHHVDQGVEALADGGFVQPVGRLELADGIEPGTALTTGNAQQTSVVHFIEQPGRGVRRAAKPVGDLAMRKMRIDRAGMHGAACANEFEHGLRLGRPDPRPGSLRCPGMHQGVILSRQKTVVDEEILLDGQARVTPFEVAGAVAGHAVPERQILRTGGRADGVGLDEAKLLDGATERGRLEQRARNGVTAQPVERDPHRAGLSVFKPPVRRP